MVANRDYAVESSECDGDYENRFDLNRRPDTSPLFCVEPIVLELAYNGSIVCVEGCTLQVTSKPW